MRSPLHGLISRSTALLTIYGQRSGKSFTFPVGYIRDGDSLLILTRDDRKWWRNLREPTDLIVRLAGQEVTATGQVIEERASVRQYVMRMIRLQENLSRFFGIEVCEDGNIDHPEKLDALLSGYLVVHIDYLRRKAHAPRPDNASSEARSS